MAGRLERVKRSTVQRKSTLDERGTGMEVEGREQLHRRTAEAADKGERALAEVLSKDGDRVAELFVEDRASLARVLTAAASHVLSGGRVAEAHAASLARAVTHDPRLLAKLLLESP